MGQLDFLKLHFFIVAHGCVLLITSDLTQAFLTVCKIGNDTKWTVALK